MMRLYLAIWFSKFYMFLGKITNNSKSDKAGLLAARICPDILSKIKKPELVIMVTGTNGKSTITNLTYEMLKKDGKKIGFNDWNANMIAGHITCLLTCVNIFNKPIKDCAILECDELTTDYTFSSVKPNYIVVTNVCRDSIRRNAYPEYIFSKINTGVSSSLDSVLILNADDPISSFLGKDNKKVYVSCDKVYSDKVYENIANDCPVCFKCNGKISYDYRHYRHIGKFKCEKCGFNSHLGDYRVTKVDVKNKKVVINKNSYPLISSSIFNIYNELMIVALFKSMGYDDKFIKECLSTFGVHKSREDLEEVLGINIYSRLAKGQNASAASCVFENMVKDDRHKQIILLLDEVYDDSNTHETITWLYDTDFEILNNEFIDKVIVITNKSYDYQLRLLLAGVSSSKIVCESDYNFAIKELNLDGKSDIYVLYEVEERPKSRLVVSAIKERIISEVKENESN